MPDVKFSIVFRALLITALAAMTIGFFGCNKPEAPPVEKKAEATPTPTPPQNLTDISSDRLKNKADKTIKALNGFLKNEDPRLQAKLQKLEDKIVHDKDGWRKKLQEKRDELQPQIEQLKERVGKAEGKSKDEVNRQLAALEAQSQNADKKLAELEGATGDAWKKIKAQLKEAETKENAASDNTDMPPTPTATP